MKIINIERLWQFGYKTNHKKNAIFPITQKPYSYSILKEGFLVVFNNYDLTDREHIIKQKLEAEINRLSKEHAIVF